MLKKFITTLPIISARRSSKLFHTTGLTDDLLAAVKDLDIRQSASSEQKRAIEASLDGRHVGLFTGTGSGKTLAYLLPIACRLKADEEYQISLRQMANETESETEKIETTEIETTEIETTEIETTTETPVVSLTHYPNGHKIPRFQPEPNRPRAIVLAPSRELCVQISGVAKKLAHNCKLRVVSLDGSGTMRSQKAALSRGADIVVATPGRLQKHRTNGNLFLSKVLCCVLDEADALVKTDFGLDAQEIVEGLTARDNSEKRSIRRGPNPEKCLFTVASATGSSDHRLQKLMKSNMPGIIMVKEDLQNRRAQRNETFIHSPVRDKYETLLPIVKSKESTLIFCNSVASCRSAEHYLREHEHTAVSYHSDMPSTIRNENFNRFKLQKVHIMVCTDIAARGLDLRHVKHVINLDFPKSKEWYLHRAGRTARAGDTGRVSSIYTKHEKERVEEMEEYVSDMKRAVNKLGEDKQRKNNRLNAVKARRKPKRYLNKKGKHGGRNIPRPIYSNVKGRKTQPFKKTSERA
jgi:superfamily II DNA/RNA helicase